MLAISNLKENLSQLDRKTLNNSATSFSSYLFSPCFTNDEEQDSKIQKRIRQLGWITVKHLSCGIDEVHSASRELVYTAITGERSILPHWSLLT